MSGIDYVPLTTKRTPTVRSADTKENLYWKTFRNISEVKLSGPVNHLCFSPIAPYHYAASSGTNVVLFSGETRQKIKSFSRFLDIAYSGNFRRDGKLLTAGDEKGTVKLFDVETKTMLRQAQPHSSAVHAVNFLSMTELVSGSDDKSICLYDIPTNMVVNTYKGHTDFVRSVSVSSSASSDLFISGGYDKCVKLWDKRLDAAQANILTITAPHPISCLYQLSQSILLAGSDKDIYVYDLLSNGKVLDVLSYHQKQVTSLSYYSSDTTDKKRVVTASLDGAVKIVDPVTFKVVHNFKFPDPILSVAISPSNILAVGTTTGIVSTRIRQEAPTKKSETPSLMPGALLSELPQQTKRLRPGLELKRVEVEQDKRRRLHKWDHYLRKFEYVKALDAVLVSRNVHDIVAVLEELRARSSLSIAVKGRSDKDLEPLISFVSYYICDPLYTSLLTSVASEILEQYGEMIGQNSLIDSQLMKLRDILDREINVQQEVFAIMGMVDTIMENARN